MCNQCSSKQYCIDCQAEQEQFLTKPSRDFNRKEEKLTRIRLIDNNNLCFEGRIFNIKSIEDNRPNIKIKTEEGFTFFIKKIDDCYVVIKYLTNKSKNKPESQAGARYKILSGQLLPETLKADHNW